MFVVEKRKLFFTLSGLLVAGAIIAIVTLGIKPGIDFEGGSILEIEYTSQEMASGETATSTEVEVGTSTEETPIVMTTEVNKPSGEEIAAAITALGVEGVRVQQSDENGYLIRTKSITEDERRAIIGVLEFEGAYTMEEKRFNSIGPVIGKELRSKAWVAIATVIIAIILFIAYVFRHVSEPVSSWKYGVIAIVALIHDILIPTGVVALLGMEVDSLFVIALLAILGLSVNDTIVVFDRVRENLRLEVSRVFSETVGISLGQTFIRSLNTSITTLFVVLTLFFVGPEATKEFALVLAIGLIAGTYSSIFLASPLLVEVERLQSEAEPEKKSKKKKKK